MRSVTAQETLLLRPLPYPLDITCDGDWSGDDPAIPNNRHIVVVAADMRNARTHTRSHNRQ